MLHVQVMDEFCDDFRVSFAFEFVSALFQERLDILVVGDDSVMDDHERVFDVRTLWMRVEVAGDTVSSPSRVRDSNVTRHWRVDVLIGHLLSNGILQNLNLSSRLDEQNVLVVNGVDGDTSRVIATVFQALQTIDEAFEHLAAGFRRKVVEICKNT